MRIAVFIASQQKGFFISTAKLLSEAGHDVSIVPYDKNVANLVRRLAPELADNMILHSEYENRPSPAQAVAEARRIEDEYGIRMSFYIGKDRALGKGYIFNADRYPYVGRAFWSHEQKLAEMVNRFRFAEHVFDTLAPDVIVGIQKFTELYCVARAKGTCYYTPAPVKLGSRYIISDDEYLTNPRFLERIAELAQSGEAGDEELGGYEQEAGSKFNHAKLSYTWKRAFKDAAKQCVGELKKLVRGYHSKDSYKLFGWVPSLLRRKVAYDYFRKHGKTPDELKGYRLAYVPLHLEPEIALLGISPEFNNTMEMIAWLSKSVPADVRLVVKEQPYSFGIRSRQYYEMLRSIGNVVLAHPDTKSWPWIEASDLVAVFTGTAGTEAVNMHRPVLSFGAHQAINCLPTVRVADSYSTTCEAVDALLAMDGADADFTHAKWALRKAQTECSFDLSGYEKTFASLEPQPELAARFVEAMKELDSRLGEVG